MSAFYRPESFPVAGIPAIVYPCPGFEKIVLRGPDAVKNHLERIYGENPALARGAYHIVILWDDGDDPMADIWIFDRVESWGSGPLVDEETYRGTARERAIGVSAGDGLVMLGREEEHRRAAKNLDEFVTGARPELPLGLVGDEIFSK